MHWCCESNFTEHAVCIVAGVSRGGCNAIFDGDAATQAFEKPL